MTNDVWKKGTMIRLVIFLVFGSWIVLSPAYRQVFDGKSTWFPRWVMFHGFGRAVCDARFFQMVDDGSGGTVRQKIDRFEVLGKERSWSTNKSLMRMSSKGEVEKVGRRLCRALGPGSDVRVLARCGSRGHWVAKHNGKTTLCTKSRTPLGFQPGDFR